MQCSIKSHDLWDILTQEDGDEVNLETVHGEVDSDNVDDDGGDDEGDDHSDWEIEMSDDETSAKSMGREGHYV